ncbi:type IX secretion system membrane protein PorP/SprF [Dyadobacter alkalitolerans]|uniref:type IX secretion system membrane protein PorP/SprF n=1 Tax=Dyadobacter alkalitolerans TaxID=492736 RepID=UPI00146FC7CC|nr:type IX secretion system membrane protein PorP/SprF [Dyadobacter alkalitolerans]
MLLGCSQTMLVQGQNTLRPNLYGPNQALNYYNVAAGLPDSTANQSLLLYGKYKSVDNDVWDKPVTVFANYLGHLKKLKGIYNVGYLNDTYSFFNRQAIYAGYSQQITLFGTRTLSLGVRAVLNLDCIRWNNWQPAFRSRNSTRLTPDIDLGLAYQGRSLAVGLSAKNLLGYSVRYNGENLLTNQREFYLSLAYAFHLSKRVTIAPFTLIRLERGLDADIGTYVGLFRRAWLSYQFRVWELRSIYSLTVNPYKGLRLGISYDQSLVHRDNNIDVLVGYCF